MNFSLRQGISIVALLGLIAGAVGVIISVGEKEGANPPQRNPVKNTGPKSDRFAKMPDTPTKMDLGKRLTLWWDRLPEPIQEKAVAVSLPSNVHPNDYVGADRCQTCHEGNHTAWSAHPHKWMNMPANPDTVRGDFSGQAKIAYRGGEARFERINGEYRMTLDRGKVHRVYRITQTIGSRFYQYYVGTQIKGPEPTIHAFFTKEFVLPFGYWLDQKEWVPIVHVGPETADSQRLDPFDPPLESRYFAEYSSSCNHCHTTFPLGDLFARRTQQMGEFAPVGLHWSLKGYLESHHPNELPTLVAEMTKENPKNPMAFWDAKHYAATFGVSCEACHLGAREHVQTQGKTPTHFLPSSPHLRVEATEKAIDPGRTHANINWACGRCHVGNRPQFAGGMSTWNSVEYSDAMRGSCYSQLTCIHCHNPHKALGPTWTLTPDQDDDRCLQCHEGFRPRDKREAHTHHPFGSAGARCMDCHMPRINEGLNDLVRTHMIYSPTRADMIEANHPNACNQCHTQEPIDWTLGYLQKWYGKTYDAAQISKQYPDRKQPVTHGWLRSENESVRLVAATSLIRKQDRTAVPLLIEFLDDPFLLNRQFTARSLEPFLGFSFRELGYRFYDPKEVRRPAIEKIGQMWKTKGK